MARSRIRAVVATALILPSLVVVGSASPLAAQPAASAQTAKLKSDVRELSRKDFTLDGKPVQTPIQYQPSSARGGAGVAAETPPVGTVRQWLGLDDFQGRLYRKNYTLRGVGNKIEVWELAPCSTSMPSTSWPSPALPASSLPPSSRRS